MLWNKQDLQSSMYVFIKKDQAQPEIPWLDISFWVLTVQRCDSEVKHPLATWSGFRWTKKSSRKQNFTICCIWTNTPWASSMWTSDWHRWLVQRWIWATCWLRLAGSGVQRRGGRLSGGGCWPMRRGAGGMHGGGAALQPPRPKIQSLFFFFSSN